MSTTFKTKHTVSDETYAKFGPKLTTALPGPKAAKVIADDDRLISPSYTRSYPMVAKSGRGIRVTDVDGNEFLDFAAGIAVNSTGHCHPEVVKAIQEQAGELLHISGTDFYYEHLVEMSERLSAIAPMKGPHKFYYGNSGAEAVEAAMKVARYHTGRQHIISFFGGFHGRTMGALSLTGSKPQQKRRFAPMVPGVTHIQYPYSYRAPASVTAGGAKAIEEWEIGCARYIEEKLFKTILPAEEVAAIILEPIQGEGGYVVAPDAFLQEIRRICNRHGILLIADEVQSGAGRTGKWWAIEHSGVEPDIVCIAKGIASGMPLGICMTRSEVMNWVPGSHASTFGGNPVCIAAALATMDIIERELMKNAATVGEMMLERLRTWVDKHSIVGEVRGRGLMAGIEIVKDKQSKAPVGPLRDRIVELAFERGILTLGCGETSIRMSPPLVVNEHEANIAMDALEAAIEQAHAEQKKPEVVVESASVGA